MTRRELLARAGALAVVPALPAMASRTLVASHGRVTGAPPLSDAQYLALADRIVARLDHTWVRGAYSAGVAHVGVVYNAALLTVHATAAEVGHAGRSRNDERARMLVDRLLASPPFFEGERLPQRLKMFHTPGWVTDLDTFDSTQDKSVDPKVAEALLAAWRARDVLGLSPEVVGRIVACVDRVARGPFFRYPSVRLNQINWNAELYAAAATLTGNPELLREDYRRHVSDFVAGVRRPLHPGDTTNLGPSYRFHYVPHLPDGARGNLDSAEYANITAHFLQVYRPALEAGMSPLPEADMVLLRAWVDRILFGYWMHSGMLNWDTGLGLRRWMKAKTWAYAQQGLLAIAVATDFHRDPSRGPWAKYLFDSGLGLYERMLTRRLPSPLLYGVRTYQNLGDERMFSARMAANATRALTAGLGRMPASAPPPFYAFDADIGRLAVSTPSYSTAIVSESRGAFPYGGVELARLFDGTGQPVGGLGASDAAAFGVVVQSPRRTVRSQSPRTGGAVRLVQSPRGPVASVRPLAAAPDAGPFDIIEAVARTVSPDADISTRYRFAAEYIDVTWTVIRRRTLWSIEAQFPTSPEVRVTAVARDGARTPLRPGAKAVPLEPVTRFDLGGYTVTPLDQHHGTARTRHVRPQVAHPRPGPVLVLRYPVHSRLRIRFRIAART